MKAVPAKHRDCSSCKRKDYGAIPGNGEGGCCSPDDIMQQ